MAMYGIAVMPLIRRLADQYKQIWYAGDANGGGRISQLKSWWDLLTEIGPSFGYYPNAEKTWLLVKEEHFQHWSANRHRRSTTPRPLLGTSKFKDEHSDSSLDISC